MPELPIPDAAEALRQARSQLLRQQIFKDLGKYTLMAGAAGVAGRGLIGLYNMARRNFGAKPRTAYSPQLFDVPYPVKEEEEKSAGLVLKHAEFPTDWTSEIGRMFRGDYARDASGVPWAWPAMAAGATAGGLGGWKLMDWLLDQRRNQEKKTELNKARQDYEGALVAQQQNKLGSALDELFSLCEKQAGLPGVPDKQQMGQALGMYLLAIGGATALTAPAIYQYFKKRQPGAILAKAQKEHRRTLAGMRPSPIYARPVPVTPVQPTGGADAAPEDEFLTPPPDEETEA